jgi:hypothetical protein
LDSEKPALPSDIVHKGRMTVSQIGVRFESRLLTKIESAKNQKHSERLPAPIALVVQTLDDLEEQKKLIRQTVLAWLENHGNKASNH